MRCCRSRLFLIACLVLFSVCAGGFGGGGGQGFHRKGKQHDTDNWAAKKRGTGRHRIFFFFGDGLREKRNISRWLLRPFFFAFSGAFPPERRQMRPAFLPYVNLTPFFIRAKKGCAYE
jgi:hypothetical protein